MKNRKKLQAQKTEISLEISVFLLFSRSDLFRPLHLSVQVKIDPVAHFFQKRTGFYTVYIH